MGVTAGNDIRVTCVYDYFDPSRPGARDTRILPWEGRTIRDLVREFNPSRPIDGYEIVASINGVLIAAPLMTSSTDCAMQDPASPVPAIGTGST